MCLVSFIPIEKGFILSSNRDESPLRDAVDIHQFSINEEQVYYPLDTKGGSWIMVSNRQRLVCILNGAYENHERRLPYKMSRGQVAKDFFSYSSAVDFFENFDFWNIEPFTMVIYDNGYLYDFRWDGSIKHVTELDLHERHVWSSCTLYPYEVVGERQELLMNKLDEIINIHADERLMRAHTYKDDDNLFNGLYMNRSEIVKTISHTQITMTSSGTSMDYYNLLANTVTTKRIA